jgi:hypothetical protein
VGFPPEGYSFLKSRIIGIAIVIGPNLQKFISIVKTKVSSLIQSMYQCWVQVKREAEFLMKVISLSGFFS